MKGETWFSGIVWHSLYWLSVTGKSLTVTGELSVSIRMEITFFWSLDDLLTRNVYSTYTKK